MHSLKRHFRKFQSELTNLEDILNDLSAQNKSYKRDTFINGSFLRVVVIWENFIEECFLSAMCSCKTLSNTVLSPKISKSKNKDHAFRKLSINNRQRNNDYLDWLDHEKVKKRVSDIFHHRSRFHRLYLNHIAINQIKAIRNHIAHNSKQTEHKFRTQIIANVGYLPVTDPNIADVLTANNRRQNKPYFKVYIDYYLSLATDICK